MQPDVSIYFLATAFMLGLRHGLDLDHVAAIADITGASVMTAIRDASPWEHNCSAMHRSTLYALGHATVLVMLGCAVRRFASMIPTWLDPAAECLIGLTLVLFSIVIFRSVIKSAFTGAEFKIRSRWMMLSAWFKSCENRTFLKLSKKNHVNSRSDSDVCGSKTAFAMGMIHGIGAETGTQMALITTIGGIKNEFFGYITLGAFIAGMIFSNSAMAVTLCTGLLSAAKMRPLFLTLGAVTSCFSFMVGFQLISGSFSCFMPVAAR
ncbi:hypothetical protein BH10CYA1_BH10CYA1_48150 [soil metagenome]